MTHIHIEDILLFLNGVGVGGLLTWLAVQLNPISDRERFSRRTRLVDSEEE